MDPFILTAGSFCVHEESARSNYLTLEYVVSEAIEDLGDSSQITCCLFTVL